MGERRKAPLRQRLRKPLDRFHILVGKRAVRDHDERRLRRISSGRRNVARTTFRPTLRARAVPSAASAVAETRADKASAAIQRIE